MTPPMTEERLTECVDLFVDDDNLMPDQAVAVDEMEAEIRRCWGVIEEMKGLYIAHSHNKVFIDNEEEP